jgi:hypothetical protein
MSRFHEANSFLPQRLISVTPMPWLHRRRSRRGGTTRSPTRTPLEDVRHLQFEDLRTGEDVAGDSTFSFRMMAPIGRIRARHDAHQDAVVRQNVARFPEQNMFDRCSLVYVLATSYRCHRRHWRQLTCCRHQCHRRHRRQPAAHADSQPPRGDRPGSPVPAPVAVAVMDGVAAHSLARNLLTHCPSNRQFLTRNMRDPAMHGCPRI